MNETLEDRSARPRRAKRSAREHAHQVLTLLGVPAAPKLIRDVHDAFFSRELQPAHLNDLRRHEERSYRAQPNARPYYLCPALTADRLSPARALLTISTWPLHQRVVGPLSPRVDFLSAAIRVAGLAIALPVRSELADGGAPAPAAARLLWRFAVQIPGAIAVSPPAGGRGHDVLDLWLVRRAAQAELDAHASADRTGRTRLAQRAREQLTELELLFGRR